MRLPDAFLITNGQKLNLYQALAQFLLFRNIKYNAAFPAFSLQVL